MDENDLLPESTDKDISFECPWCAERDILPFRFGMTDRNGSTDYYFHWHLCKREPVSEVTFRVERKVLTS